MPVSNYSNILPIMTEVRKLHKTKPLESVLDIGFGFGKYGFLLREFLSARVKNCQPPWNIRIDGVEIWDAYVNNLHKFIYNNIYHGDILDLVEVLPTYDLVIMSEVIEHIDKDKGLQFLLNLNFNRALIITTPQVFEPRAGRGWENPYEKHVSLWKRTELSYIFPNLKQLTNTAFLVTKDG